MSENTDALPFDLSPIAREITKLSDPEILPGHHGYRSSLAQARFHSPDSWSPFERGGVNPYAYCMGDPVSFKAPD